MPIFTSFVVTISSEFLVTPKLGVLLQILSFWAKHSEFTPKFGAPRLGHHFCSLKGWKILSGSWESQHFSHKILVTKFWSQHFGHKILVTTFWSQHFGHKILVTKFGHNMLVKKCWSQNVGHKVLITKFWSTDQQTDRQTTWLLVLPRAAKKQEQYLFLLDFWCFPNRWGRGGVGGQKKNQAPWGALNLI